MADLPAPESRKEQYLAKAAGVEVSDLPVPASREEEFLNAIAESGGGGSGTSNFNDLSNRPSYAGETMSGSTVIPSVTDAVNVVDSKIGGDLSNLDTTDKTSLIAAINELANSVGKDAVKVLTSADANYPANNPIYVALWLLDDGLYQWEIDGNLSVAAQNNIRDSGAPGAAWVYTSSDGFKQILYFSNNRAILTKVRVSDGAASSATYPINLATSVIDNLITSSADEALSANQGKVLKTQIGDLSTLDTTAQSDLVSAINEIAGQSGSGIVELTSSDYDYPTNSPTSVALWKLDNGIYSMQIGLHYRPLSNTELTYGGFAIVTSLDTAAKEILLVQVSTAAEDHLQFYHVTTDGVTWQDSTGILTGKMLKNNLTQSTAGFPLDAAQGKVLKDTIDALLSNVPTPVSANDAANKNYVDTAATASGTAAVETVAETMSYSTEEVDTGTTWINGKAIYKKTIDVGALPNNSYTEFQHNIDGIESVVKYEGIAIDATTNATTLTIPYAATGDSGAMECWVSRSIILVATDSDRTGYTGYITIYYTKSA